MPLKKTPASDSGLIESGKTQTIAPAGNPQVERLCSEIENLAAKLRQLTHELGVEAPRFDMDKPWRTDPLHADEIVERQIQRLARMRRARTRYLPEHLLGEPAWDVLLDLMLAYLRNESVYTGLLMQTLGLSDAKLMRALAQLEAAGFVAGSLDTTDPRHVFVWLTEPGARRMRHIIDYL